MGKPALSFVMSLLGRYEELINEFDQCIKEIRCLPEDIEIIIVADGSRWTASPLFQMLPIWLPDAKIIILEEETNLPAMLINRGIACSEGEFVTFGHLKMGDISQMLNVFITAIDGFHRAQVDDVLNASPPVFYTRWGSNEGALCYLSNQNIYGFCQAGHMLSLYQVCVAKKTLDHVGPWDETPLLQYEIERWIMLKLSLITQFEQVAITGERTIGLSVYPFSERFPVNEAIFWRYAIYSNDPAFTQSLHGDTMQNFINDLNEEEAAALFKFTDRRPQRDIAHQTKYKIMVIGGYWEYHHNQVCFFNYLERLKGTGFATFGVGFDFDMDEARLLGYDLVIFSRCRNANALKLMQFCNDHHIASMYMIDDNWMTIAQEHPAIGSIFVKGNANYDNFLEALSLCKTTWLFSDLIKEDILAYTRDTEKFKVSVEPLHFQTDNKREREHILVGFSGTLRFDDIAFKALARYARQNPDIKILLAGVVSNEQMEYFEGIDVTRVDFCSYGLYAKKMAKISPDLLLAPLVDTRTSQSKCYNKYIESGILGAVCIFSKQLPYTEIVTEGVNGYFVEEETEEGWYQKIDQVLSDIDGLRKVQACALKDIITNHTVANMLDAFTEKISNIIQKEVVEND